MGCKSSKTKDQKGDDARSVDYNIAVPTKDAYDHGHGDSGCRYHLGGPSVTGEETVCFEDGLLYRVVDDNRWSFYNDSQEFESHVKVTFAPGSALTALGNTQLVKQKDGTQVATVVVCPGVTEDFVCGEFSDYNVALNAKPLSKKFRTMIHNNAMVKVNKEEATMKSLTSGGDLESMLSACAQNSAMFVDPTFAPCARTLSPADEQDPVLLVAWQRPTDYLPGDTGAGLPKLEHPGLTGIEPGLVGDGWFGSAVAGVAERITFVERLFMPQVDREQAEKEVEIGAFRVLVNKDGWWTRVIIDNYLPTIGGRPCVAHCRDERKGVWVSLLEKALAKTRGSYAALIGGDAVDGLHDITGFPGGRFDAEWVKARGNGDDSRELFARLERYDAEEYIICLEPHGVEQNSAAPVDAATVPAAGLALPVADVKSFPEKNLKLLQLRDPWKGGSWWSGAWSAGSTKWVENPDVAEECGPHDESTGCIWIEWEDALQQFDGGCVCPVRPTWQDYRVRGVFKDVFPSVALEVHVTKRVHAFAVLTQNTLSEGEYGAAMLSVARTGEGNKMSVHLSSGVNAMAPTEEFTFSHSRDRALPYTFDPRHSPYLVVPRLHKGGMRDMGFTLGLLTELPVGDAMTVRFKELSNESRVFGNFRRFTYDAAEAPDAVTEYQCSSVTEAPTEGSGSAIEPKNVE